MSRGRVNGTVTRPTPAQAATMATSGSARAARALARAPLIHVRGPDRVARVLVVSVLLLALAATAVLVWS